MLCAAPCMAAEDFRTFGSGERRSAAFAGANVRLELGRKIAAPTARLQLTMTHSYEDRRSAAPARRFGGRGLELGLAQGKQPAFFLNGRDFASTQRRLGLNGTTKPLLIVAGVLIAAAVAYAVIDDCDACNRALE